MSVKEAAKTRTFRTTVCPWTCPWRHRGWQLILYTSTVTLLHGWCRSISLLIKHVVHLRENVRILTFYDGMIERIRNSCGRCSSPGARCSYRPLAVCGWPWRHQAIARPATTRSRRLVVCTRGMTDNRVGRGRHNWLVSPAEREREEERDIGDTLLARCCCCCCWVRSLGAVVLGRSSRGGAEQHHQNILFLTNSKKWVW